MSKLFKFAFRLLFKLLLLALCLFVVTFVVYFFNLAFGPVTDALKKVVPSFFSFLIALIKAIATALIAAVKSVI